MITYPLDFSTLLTPARIEIVPMTSEGSSESPFTLQEQIYVHAGARWMMNVDFPPCVRADAEELIGELLALNGREGTFLLGDPANRSPRGTAPGAPVVMGSGQSGKTLLSDGWTPSRSGILLRGDWLQLGTGASSELHKITAPASSDVYGGASLEIWPPIRTAPADNDAIVVTSPKGLWRLAPGQGGWTIGLAKIYGIQFSALEAI